MRLRGRSLRQRGVRLRGAWGSERLEAATRLRGALLRGLRLRRVRLRGALRLRGAWSEAQSHGGRLRGSPLLGVRLRGLLGGRPRGVDGPQLARRAHMRAGGGP
eukprot:15475588-Alexandrium_andersonii.AAC.1